MSIDTAINYHRRNWSPVPVPFKAKGPLLEGWQNLRLTEADLPRYFNGHPQNIGILLGDPSGGLIDIDLDCPEAVELAPQYLPPTGSIFGRASKPGSHWEYYATGTLPETKQWKTKEKKMLLEFRSTGVQTVFPGSVHPEGESIEWELDEEPATVPADELMAACLRLLAAVKAKRGIVDTPAPERQTRQSKGTSARVSAADRAAKYIAKMPPAISGQGGHDCTFAAACALVLGFDLAPDEAFPLLAEWNLSHCQPVWAEHELRHKLNSANEKTDERGYLLTAQRAIGTTSTVDVSHSGQARPQIDTGCQELPVITTQAWTAIQAANDPPSLFRSAGEPARIEAGDDGEPVVKPLDFHRLRHHAARVADWVAHKKSGDDVVEYLTAPPVNVINDMLATPAPPLPVLRGIAQSPIFASDGTLQTTPGYHPRSGVFYAPAKGFSVPDVSPRPTEDELRRARGLLCDDLLGDFPFIDEPEQAHAAALALHAFARDLIDGPTPLHLIEKPSPGTGATLLVDMITFPALGYPVSVMTEGRDEDEWRKRMTSKLRTMPAFISIDNLRRRLDSAAVSSAITSRSWEDRKLGATEMLKIPVRCAWIATGNNPALSTEIARRTIRIRLDARQDRPWLRTGFRHENLRAWAEENRGLLVWALLTMIQAWLAAGRPKGANRLGMFEQWSEVIGGVLSVAGIPGFLGNLSQFYEASDAEGETWRIFLGAWLEQFDNQEVSSKELWPLAIEADLSLGEKSEQSQRILLGKLIGEKRDRVYDLSTGRVRITKAGTQKRATLWQLNPDG